LNSSIHTFFAHIALRYDMHISTQHASMKHYPTHWPPSYPIAPLSAHLPQCLILVSVGV
jgi:hypothetical protein